jgi:hypothetical protein
MTVAILGAGTVGRALGGRLLEIGEDMHFGVRDPSSAARKLTGELDRATPLATAEAVHHSNLILLAVPAAAALEVVRSAGSVEGGNPDLNRQQTAPTPLPAISIGCRSPAYPVSPRQSGWSPPGGAPSLDSTSRSRPRPG